MRNVKYLFSLAPCLSRAGLDATLARKIKNYALAADTRLDALDYSLFCFKCCVLAVPTVTARVRLCGRSLEVQCTGCKRAQSVQTKEEDGRGAKRLRTDAVHLSDLLAE